MKTKTKTHTPDDCPVCRDEGLIQNPNGELICLDCGWASSGIGLSRRAMIQAQYGYEEGVR